MTEREVIMALNDGIFVRWTPPEHFRPRGVSTNGRWAICNYSGDPPPGGMPQGSMGRLHPSAYLVITPDDPDKVLRQMNSIGVESGSFLLQRERWVELSLTKDKIFGERNTDVTVECSCGCGLPVRLSHSQNNRFRYPTMAIRARDCTSCAPSNNNGLIYDGGKFVVYRVPNS